MLKKIYSLLASILLLSACTTDDMMQEKNPVDDSMVSVSFQVDVPSATVITKSVDVPTDEVGIVNLKLITFDATGNHLGTVSAMYASGNSYSATISKETRKVQFVANYDDYESIKTPAAAANAATTEYAFFSEQHLSEGFTSLKDVELLRNWSKISLADVSGRLSDVEFMVYNASSKATVAPGTGAINLPAGNSLNKDQTFVSIGTDLHTFEQEASGESPAFVIVKAKYDGGSDFTYYKLDLAVTNTSTGVVTNYDIIRNNWYKITISSVQRKGVTWDEVIKSGKIADNNITASAELDKYPSISFGGETLEVTKTTYVFTKASGNELNTLATYTNTNGGVSGYNGLTLIQDEAVSNVVNGKISMQNENGSGRITANIKNPSNEEEISYFYIKGGNLQRKITLILRNPYDFQDVNFYKTSDVNASYIDGTTNKITSGPDNPVWFGFTIPEDVDASIFPLECKIKSTTLYAVTDGVRIETDPADDKVYYYVYTAKNAGRHAIEFKTNATVAGETASLTAEYFRDNSAAYVTDAPKYISGKIQYARNSETGVSIPSNSIVSYTVDGITKTFTVGSNGSYTLGLSQDTPDNANISFSYTDSEGRVHALETTVGSLNEKTIVLRRYVTVISGKAYYTNNNVCPYNSTIKYSINGVEYSTTVEGWKGNYSIEIPNDMPDETIIKFSYTRSYYNYALETTVSTLKQNGDITLIRVYSGTMKYSLNNSNITGTVLWQSEDGSKNGTIEVTNGSYSTTLDGYDMSDGVFFTFTNNGINYFLYRTGEGNFTLTRTIGNGKANIRGNLAAGSKVECYILDDDNSKGGDMTITRRNNSSRYSLTTSENVTVNTKVYFYFNQKYTESVSIGEMLKEIDSYALNINQSSKPTK